MIGLVFVPLRFPSPPLPIQQKAVDAYNAIAENLQTYTAGLNNLKLTCDLFMDNIKKSCKREEISNLMEEVDVRNINEQYKNVLGINIEKSFMPSVANLSETDISKYKVIKKGQFAYSAMQTGRDKTIRVALYNQAENAVISPAYSVLQVKQVRMSEVLAEYLMIWFHRQESDRFGWFLSDGSVRASLELTRFFQVKIPIPPLPIQQSIVAIYKAQYERQQIAEQLGKMLKDICPVLIKQSVTEK